MQTAFMSGSAAGIGAGLVSKLLKEGWQIFAGYRNSPPETASWLGNPRVIPIKYDVTSIADVEAVARLVASQSGNALDLLINNGTIPSMIQTSLPKRFTGKLSPENT